VVHKNAKRPKTTLSATTPPSLSDDISKINTYKNAAKGLKRDCCHNRNEKLANSKVSKTVNSKKSFYKTSEFMGMLEYMILEKITKFQDSMHIAIEPERQNECKERIISILDKRFGLNLKNMIINNKDDEISPIKRIIGATIQSCLYMNSKQGPSISKFTFKGSAESSSMISKQYN
jgi:hypothetical protein